MRVWPGARATYCDIDCPDPHLVACEPCGVDATLYYAPIGYAVLFPSPQLQAGIGGFRIGIDAVGVGSVGVGPPFPAPAVPLYQTLAGAFIHDPQIPASALGQANGRYVPSWLPVNP